MMYGTCDGCKLYFATTPLTALYSEFWRTHIFLCPNCMKDDSLDREAVAESVDP